MKKLMLTVSTLALSAVLSISAMAGRPAASLHGGHGHGGVRSGGYCSRSCSYVDANGDGICDTCGGYHRTAWTGSWQNGCHRSGHCGRGC